MGSTGRHLYERVAEHAGKSSRTGARLLSPPHSKIRLHAEECDCHVNLQSFTVLASGSSMTDVRVLESLFIHKLKPTLNDQLSAFPLQIVS